VGVGTRHCVIGMRPAVAQRAVLTAVSDVRIICPAAPRGRGIRAAAVVSAGEVGGLIDSSACVTTVDEREAHSCVHVLLVLRERLDVDYARTARCILSRVESLESLSGGAPYASRCAPPRVRVTLDVHVRSTTSSQRVVPSDTAALGEEALDLALHRNATDRAFGLRDLRHAALEARLTFLLLLGEEEAPWLDALQSGGGCELLEVEELAGACCATGCEPCVWERYYCEQARRRREVAAKRRRGASCGTSTQLVHAVDDGKQISEGEVADWGGVVENPRDGNPTGGGERNVSLRLGQDQGVPLLSPEMAQEVRLLSRQQTTADTMLLTFAAAVAPLPTPPWHVRLSISCAGGQRVVRSYTPLPPSARSVELLVKQHTNGRASQCLATMPEGTAVAMHGPVRTDRPLGAALVVTRALHCLTAGTGLAPSLQLAEAVVARREGSTSRAEGAVVRLYSFHRTRDDVLLAERLAALQRRGRAVDVCVHCNFVLTREAKGALINDPCAQFGGEAAVLYGRPAVDILFHAVPLEEFENALVMVCGAQSFNSDMETAVRVRYANERVFVREAPATTHDAQIEEMHPADVK